MDKCNRKDHESSPQNDIVPCRVSVLEKQTIENRHENSQLNGGHPTAKGG